MLFERPLLHQIPLLGIEDSAVPSLTVSINALTLSAVLILGYVHHFYHLYTLDVTLFDEITKIHERKLLAWNGNV